MRIVADAEAGRAERMASVVLAGDYDPDLYAGYDASFARDFAYPRILPADDELGAAFGRAVAYAQDISDASERWSTVVRHRC